MKSGKTRHGHAVGTASAYGDRAGALYDQYAAGLYSQALLTLDDPGVAEQVVCDVLAEEYGRAPAPEDDGADASYRLAVSAYRRCEELGRNLDRDDRGPGKPPSGRVANCIDPGGLLSGKERGALGLVLFGGLGYVEASRELAMAPLDVATLLCTVLRRLASPAEAPWPSVAPGE
jgi:hypothetical protein